MADEVLSAFDPQTFLNAESDAQFETRYTPYPEDDYMAQIDSLSAKRLDDGQIIVEVLYELLDVEKMKETLGLAGKVLAKQALWCDFEADGSLSEGANKNIKLGKLRAAIGQDKKGKKWAFGHLKGAGPLMVHVIQKPAKEGASDPDAIYNEVNRTAAM